MKKLMSVVMFIILLSGVGGWSAFWVNEVQWKRRVNEIADMVTYVQRRNDTKPEIPPFFSKWPIRRQAQLLRELDRLNQMSFSERWRTMARSGYKLWF